MQDGDDRIGVQLRRHNTDRLVLVRVEPGASAWVDREHFVAFESRDQLAQGGLCAFADLLNAGVLDEQTGFQAVSNWKQALGKSLNGKSARLRDLVFGPATRIFGFGLGT